MGEWARRGGDCGSSEPRSGLAGECGGPQSRWGFPALGRVRGSVAKVPLTGRPLRAGSRRRSVSLVTPVPPAPISGLGDGAASMPVLLGGARGGVPRAGGASGSWLLPRP